LNLELLLAIRKVIGLSCWVQEKLKSSGYYRLQPRGVVKIQPLTDSIHASWIPPTLETVSKLCFPAAKARSVIAQGMALGKFRITTFEALKARNSGGAEKPPHFLPMRLHCAPSALKMYGWLRTWADGPGYHISRLRRREAEF